MDQQQTTEIKNYLSGPRNYIEGVALYNRYGHNLMFKRRFVAEESTFTRELLTEELRKLAGLTEAELQRLPRRAKTAPVVASAVIGTEQLPEPRKLQRAEPPETVKKIIRFRERYPFLSSPDCPDILKVLVNDMFTAFETYKTTFAHLHTIPDATIAEAAEAAEKVVEAYLADREIVAELDHYRDTGEILGKAAKFRQLTCEEEPADELTELSDLDLVKKLNSARANQSKRAKALEKAEATGADIAKLTDDHARWTNIRYRIEAEIERRKKNG